MNFTLLLVIISLALIFDFINGFHDAANSIATVVSTKVLSPIQAVVWAAFFNFVAYLIFELHIANTIAKVVNYLEFIYVVFRYTIKFFSYPRRRFRRSCSCTCRLECCA